MHVGFIGLGNVGGKLAGSALRNGFELTVCDLDTDRVDSLRRARGRMRRPIPPR